MALSITVPVDVVHPGYFKEHFGEGVPADELTARVTTILGMNPNITPRDIATFFRRGGFPLVQKAKILDASGKADLAKRRLERIREEDFGYGFAQFYLGVTEFDDNGDKRKAKECLKKVGEAEDEFGLSQFYLGIIANEDNNPEEAEGHWNNVHIEHEMYGWAQMEIAFMAYKAGDISKTIRHLESIPPTDSQYNRVQEYLTNIRNGNFPKFS